MRSRIALVLSLIVVGLLLVDTGSASFFVVPRERVDLYDAIGPNAVGNQIQGVPRRMGGVIRPGTVRTRTGMFRDVDANHENLDAIQYVAQYGILRGFSDRTFRPDLSITRGEFTHAVADQVFSTDAIEECFERISFPYPPSYSNLFTDVEKEGEQAKRICAALKANIIHGYGDGTFRPEDPINFAEASKILVRGYDVSFLPYRGFGNEWFQRYVQSLADRAGIPLSIGHFDSQITRADAAELLYRADANVTGKPSLSYDDLVSSAALKIAEVLLKLAL